MSRFSERLITSIGLSLWFCFVYIGCNYLTHLRNDRGIAAFSWEQWIPFIPVLIIPYWSIDAFFFAASFFIPSREKLQLFRRRIWCNITLAGIFFIAFPLELTSQHPPLEGVLGFLFRSLDQMYNFYNLAPSLHVSLRCILWTVYIPLLSGLPRFALQAWFILIGASTLFCWQHHVIDVFTGQIVGFAILHLLPERMLNPGDVSFEKHINSNRRIAGLYYLGAALFVLLIRLLPLWGIIFLWPAAALFVVGAGYSRLGPAIFRKRDGIIPPGTRLFLAPFYLGLWISYRYLTWRRDPWNEIAPGIYLGRALRVGDEALFTGLGIKEVIDVTAEWSECPALRKLTYHNIPILDLTRPSPAQLEEVRTLLQKAGTEHPVYLHCALGLGRSAKAALYYLLFEKLTDTIEAGAELLEAKRPGILISGEAKSYLLQTCQVPLK